MRLKTVPEHHRRALRLFLGVGIPCLLGYGVILPDTQWAYSKSFASACKWAAITAVIVNLSVIGKVSQVGAERTIGTVAGGLLGYLVHHVGSALWTEESDGVVLSLVAALMAAASVLVGTRLGLDMSARLFTITFLLVTFGAQGGSDPLLFASMRIGGIVSGVLLMLLLSILVLPKSASMECVHNLEKALQSLSKLNALAWKKYLPQQGSAGCTAAASGATLRQRKATRERYHALADGEGLTAPLLPNSPTSAVQAGALPSGGLDAKGEFERYQEGCEKVLTDIYNQLAKLQENADLAKSEILLGSWRGHVVFIPGPPFVGLDSKHMPWEEIGDMAGGIRRVARLLLTLIANFEQDFDREMQAVLGPQFPMNLMQELAEAAQEAITGMCLGFPLGSTCCTAELRRLTAAVTKLAGVSDAQRKGIIRALRGNKQRKFAQDAWQRLIHSAQERGVSEEGTLPERSPRSAPALQAPPGPGQRPREQGAEETIIRIDPGVPAADGLGDDSQQQAQQRQHAEQGQQGQHPESEQAPSPAPARAASLLGSLSLAGSWRAARGAVGYAASSLSARLLGGGGGANAAGDAAASRPPAEPAEPAVAPALTSDAAQLQAAAAQVKKDLVGGSSVASSRSTSVAEGLAGLALGGTLGVSEEASAPRTPGPVPAGAASTGAGAVIWARVPSPTGEPAPALRRPSPSPTQQAARGSGSPRAGQPLWRTLPGEPRDPSARPALRRLGSREAMGSNEMLPAMAEEGEGSEGRRRSSGGSRAELLKSETLRRAMFPETTEGYVAQLRWYSFQFLMEEMLDDVVELHADMHKTRLCLRGMFKAE